MSLKHMKIERFLFAVFIVSGFTGLIYESIWSHYLQLFLGHAAYAQTLVLGIYMGGLALGSWIVARRSQRLRRLLRGYAIVEGLIGLCGVLFHPVFLAAMSLAFDSVIPALSSPRLTVLFKWSLGAVLILPQSVLLGMTFPLLSGGLIRRRPESPGDTLASLYFTNSLGAAIGVLVSGFLLIDAVGLPGTIGTAAILNLLLAAAVGWAVRGMDEPPPRFEQPAPGAPRRDELSSWLIVAAGVTGAASFMYELGWIRMLSLVLGSSTHSFELMLSAFILGLAFGGLAVRRRIDRLRDPALYLAIVFLVMGALAALTLPAYNFCFDLMAWFLRVFPRDEGGYVGFNLASQLIAAAIMMPATFCAGMTLPLLTRALLGRGAGERAIGSVYAANTLGAIVGVMLAIHLLLPLIGVKGVILGGAGLHLMLGTTGLLASARIAALRWATLASSLGIFFFALLATRPDPLRMTSGVYRTGAATLPEGAVVDYLRDGKTATISLVEREGRVTIATNGKPDAGIQMGPGEPSPDEVTMVMAAALPLSMQPHPDRVANIGFGSGLTTHTLLASARVGRLDSIEIEPFMVQAARQGYYQRISNVFTDPRSHIVLEDAKTFLASAHQPYDLIVSEPSNPWVSGVATLFSDEFYARIAHYLAPDGYFAQWMQVYETNTGIIASVIKALAPHFGAYAIYNVDDVDMLIIATRAESLRAPDETLVDSVLMRQELRRVGIQSVGDFKSREMGNHRTLGPLLQGMPAPANSDFHPFVDLHAPRARFLRQTAIDLPALTVLPVPILELLGGARPAATTAQPAPNSALFRDGLIRRAIQVRDAAASGDLNGLDPVTARDLSRVLLEPERCRSAQGLAEWRAALRSVSDATTSFLSPQELGPIWTRLLASPCHAAVTGNARLWVDLLSAVAQRDAPGIVRTGSHLLQDPSSLSDDDAALLAAVTAAAALAAGQPGQAAALLQEQWPRVQGNEKFGFVLRDLAAIARVRNHA